MFFLKSRKKSEYYFYSETVLLPLYLFFRICQAVLFIFLSASKYENQSFLCPEAGFLCSTLRIYYLLFSKNSPEFSFLIKINFW